MGVMMQIICLALLYKIPETEAVSGVCSGDNCTDVISMPLMRNDLKATLTADLDVSLMNKYLTDYIKQEIKLGVESAVKELLEQMVDNKTEKAIANMKAILKDAKTEADTYISRKITDFESIFERKDRPKYAFFAHLSSPKSNLPPDSVVVFDVVALNIGNSYSGTTGKFTCQEDGVYTFSWTTMSEPKKDLTSCLVIDGNVVAANGVDNDEVSDHMTGSVTVVVNLRKGQSVWIKVYSIDGKHITATWGGPCSVLSGFKIY